MVPHLLVLFKIPASSSWTCSKCSTAGSNAGCKCGDDTTQEQLLHGWFRRGLHYLVTVRRTWLDLDLSPCMVFSFLPSLLPHQGQLGYAMIVIKQNVIFYSPDSQYSTLLMSFSLKYMIKYCKLLLFRPWLGNRRTFIFSLFLSMWQINDEMFLGFPWCLTTYHTLSTTEFKLALPYYHLFTHTTH